MYPPYVNPNPPMFVAQPPGLQMQQPTSYHRYEPEKFGYNSRKDSQDSGIYDSSNPSSRKTSNSSTVSAATISEEPGLEDVLEEGPFEEPDEELSAQLALQVEFYFSDANITKDKFLLKHVKRNKDGFVSLKLISSFKRIKQLTKNWRQVAYAVEHNSTKLEVNDLKSKVRRIDPLPEYDETTPSRTVIAMDVPLDRPTIESVAELFSSCGEITLVRILRPGNPVPADVRPFVTKHPEMTTKVCALIEFESTDYALAAVETLNNNEEGKMKVMELSCPVKKTDERRKVSFSKLPPSTSMPQRRYSHGMAPPQISMPPQYNVNVMSAGQPGSIQRRKISLSHNIKFTTKMEEQAKCKGYLNPNAPVFTMQQRRVSRPTLVNGHALVMEHLGGGSQPEASSRAGRRSVGELAASGLTLPINVIRQPRGPDSSAGFHPGCRNITGTPQASGVEVQAEEVVNQLEAIVISDVEDDVSEGDDVEGDHGIDVANIVEGPFAENIKSFQTSFLSKGDERTR